MTPAACDTLALGQISSTAKGIGPPLPSLPCRRPTIAIRVVHQHHYLVADADAETSGNRLCAGNGIAWTSGQVPVSSILSLSTHLSLAWSDTLPTPTSPTLWPPAVLCLLLLPPCGSLVKGGLYPLHRRVFLYAIGGCQLPRQEPLGSAEETPVACRRCPSRVAPR